jgi:hypothetical protein
MREIRQSGSEGGGNEQTVSPYPYFTLLLLLFFFYFFFPQLPTLLSMPSSPSTALGGSAF